MIHSQYAVGTSTNDPIVTVNVLGPMSGNLLLNVNRWRSQLALPPVDSSALPSATQALEVDGAKGTLFEAVGSTKRMVVAIVPHEESTWFFKIFGPDSAVASEKATFLTFVKSVRFH